MATRTKPTEHTGFRNGDLFCYHCGDSHKLNLPAPVKDAAQAMIDFSERHKKCKKTWDEPVADPQDKNTKECADWWLKYGERGVSSETMFMRLDGREIRQGGSHPYDPSDFRRCYLLLNAVPQWRSQLHKLKTISPVWSNLVDNWDKLTEMLEEQMKTNQPNGMYEFMKKLGC